MRKRAGDLIRIAQKSLIRQACAGADDGGPEFGKQGLANSVIGHSDADCLAILQEDPGNLFRCRQDESERSREETPHDFVSTIRDVGIFGDALEIRADETEKLAFVVAFDLIDLLDCFFIKQVAAQPVNGVGRIYDYSAVSEHVTGNSQMTPLRVDRVYRESLHIRAHSSVRGIIPQYTGEAISLRDLSKLRVRTYFLAKLAVVCIFSIMKGVLT